MKVLIYLYSLYYWFFYSPDSVIKRFGNSSDPEDQLAVANAYLKKAEKVLEKPEEYLLKNPQKVEVALACYDEVIKRFRGCLKLQHEIFLAFIGKGLLLNKAGNTKGAIQVWSDALKRFRGSTYPNMEKHIASTYLWKASALYNEPDGIEEALECYSELIKKYKHKPHLQCEVARAFSDKALLLIALNKPKEALRYCNEAIKHYQGATDADLGVELAIICHHKVNALEYIGNHDEVARCRDELISSYQNHTHPWVQEVVAMAYVAKGLASPEKALEYFNETISRLKNSQSYYAQKTLARTYIEMGGLLFEETGRNKKSIRCLDKVIRRFEHTPYLQGEVAEAYYYKGIMLDIQGKNKQAIRCWNESVRRLDSISPEFQEMILANISLTRGLVSKQRGNLDEALKHYSQVIDSFEGSTSQKTQAYVAKAYHDKAAAIIDEPDRTAETMGYLRESISRLESSTDPRDQEQLGVVYYMTGKVMFEQTENYWEALEYLNRTIKLLTNSTHPILRLILGNAYEGKSLALSYLGEAEESLQFQKMSIDTLKHSQHPTVQLRVWISRAAIIVDKAMRFVIGR